MSNTLTMKKCTRGSRIEALSAVNAPFASAASVGEVHVLVNPRGQHGILVTRELLHMIVACVVSRDTTEKKRRTNHEVAEAENLGVSPLRQHPASLAPLIVQGSHRESSIVAHARHRHGLVRVAAEKKYTERLGKGGVASIRVERGALEEREAADGEEDTVAVARIRRARDELKTGAHDGMSARTRGAVLPTV